MKIILLGAPGAGKGTQAALIKDRYGIPHISTGDIFRANIREGTPLGIKVKSIIDSGNLVPDGLTVEIVKDRLSKPDCDGGYILDGFPRTLAQAEALDGFTDIDVVIDVAVPAETVVKRISGRRMCKCGETYHISTYKDACCAKCSQPLYQRDDDKEDVVKERLRVYESHTKPIADHYAAKGKLSVVEGTGSVETIFADIARILDDHR